MRVSNDVLAVLSRAQTDGNTLKLTEQLERPMYVAVNKVLEAAGGKWQRGRQVHVFDQPAANAMEQIILTGEITVPQDFGYYPTPLPVIAQMLELARIGPRWRSPRELEVLEPSAGQGAIADALAFLGCRVDVVELLDSNIKVLMSPEKAGTRRKFMSGDFLKIQPGMGASNYDRIVMNPPFEKRADIHHVMHALKFLKPDGLLVSVMSAGVIFRSDKLTTEFRDLVERRGGHIEELPDESFRESGTSVRTVLVTIPGEDA
jgi:predicted RNA methylase